MGTAGEVDKLVYFFLEGLPLIEDQFNRILREHNVHATLSGIFCHQAPKVIPTPTQSGLGNSCELGDILFLVTYGKRLYGSFLGNAMLVQAKLDANSVEGTLQEYLYRQANGFSYFRAGTLSGQSRHLHEGTNALWFWGFEPRYSWPLSHETEGIRARRSGSRHTHMPFEIALADLICGVNGRRARALEANATDSGWSKIVDDLIRTTARSAFHRQNAYVSRNREPLRGEDAVRAVDAALSSPPDNTPFLIRSSFGRILSIFDQELAGLGQKLEAGGKDFHEDTFKAQHPRRFPGPSDDLKDNLPPPPLGNERPPEGDEGGGCSFVIMDFSTT